MQRSQSANPSTPFKQPPPSPFQALGSTMSHSPPQVPAETADGPLLPRPREDSFPSTGYIEKGVTRIERVETALASFAIKVFSPYRPLPSLHPHHTWDNAKVPVIIRRQVFFGSIERTTQTGKRVSKGTANPVRDKIDATIPT
ncbi:hypothetical protein LZ31DRAFT_320907 [Colletotrichum somersetense]|nr:hypothetical protein LZ31DRAFT_320907 [Colletotrichum somersetense]